MAGRQAGKERILKRLIYNRQLMVDKYREAESILGASYKLRRKVRKKAKSKYKNN